VGSKAGLDRCGKSLPPPGFDPPAPTRAELYRQLSQPTYKSFRNSKGLEDEPLRGRLILKEFESKKKM
jgi:hypothetical protein